MSRITMNPTNFKYLDKSGSYPIVYLDYSYVKYLMSVSMKNNNPMDKSWIFTITLIVKKGEKAESMQCNLKNVFYGKTERLTLHSILMDDFCLNGVDNVVPTSKPIAMTEAENLAMGLVKSQVPVNIDSTEPSQSKKRELIRLEVSVSHPMYALVEEKSPELSQDMKLKRLDWIVNSEYWVDDIGKINMSLSNDNIALSAELDNQAKHINNNIILPMQEILNNFFEKPKGIFKYFKSKTVSLSESETQLVTRHLQRIIDIDPRQFNKVQDSLNTLMENLDNLVTELNFGIESVSLVANDDEENYKYLLHKDLMNNILFSLNINKARLHVIRKNFDTKYHNFDKLRNAYLPMVITGLQSCVDENVGGETIQLIDSIIKLK